MTRGAVMHVSEDVTSTLRANTKHHEPIVLVLNGKADGASGVGISFSITGDHDNRPTDMTNLIIQQRPEDERTDCT